MPASEDSGVPALRIACRVLMPLASTGPGAWSRIQSKARKLFVVSMMSRAGASPSTDWVS